MTKENWTMVIWLISLFSAIVVAFAKDIAATSKPFHYGCSFNFKKNLHVGEFLVDHKTVLSVIKK